MRTIFLSLVTFFAVLGANAQFYPGANAIWCGAILIESQSGFYAQFQMAESPDTLIDGIAYKTIYGYYNASGNYVLFGAYFVRSDSNGKGYVRMLGSQAEFLAGDLSAQEGDTVRDVVVGVWDPPSFTFLSLDLVVDSIVVLSNAGITVTRHYLDPTPLDPFNEFNPMNASQVFWQEGMGTSFGPFVIVSSSFVQCAVNDSMQYNTGNGGLPEPGVVGLICSPLATGVDESIGQLQSAVHPNPSTGQFTLGHAPPINTIVVYTSTGQQIWQGSGNTIDLTAQPPGVYTAVVATERGRQAVRLVVVR